MFPQTLLLLQLFAAQNVYLPPILLQRDEGLASHPAGHAAHAACDVQVNEWSG